MRDTGITLIRRHKLLWGATTASCSVLYCSPDDQPFDLLLLFDNAGSMFAGDAPAGGGPHRQEKAGSPRKVDVAMSPQSRSRYPDAQVLARKGYVIPKGTQ